MPRHLFDSEYLFGIHEPGGEPHMIELGRPGWIVFTEALGSDPNDKSGRDYRQYAGRGLGVIVRLNNGYHPGGTIPNRGQYQNFAQRCANFVAASQGCKLWIIGNEMNFAIERPPRVAAAPEPDREAPVSAPGASPGGSWARWFKRALSPSQATPRPDPKGDPFYHSDKGRFNVIKDPASAAPKPLPPGVEGTQADAQALSDGDGEVITPEMYVRCYKACRARIQTQQGHGTDKVLIGAVAPWNNQTRYPGNEGGDWVKYFRDILAMLGPDSCDGITLHTYTHGNDANLVTSDDKMNPPFQNRFYHFRAYQDFMRAVPTNMRHLPVYITETDQDVEWLDRNVAWVQRAYGEINWWNRQTGNQQIHALVLYRWPKIDKWYIEGKQGVIDDFRAAMKEDYRWQRVTAPPLSVRNGDTVRTKDWLNLRETPAGKVAGQVPARAVCKVVNGAPTLAEGVYWWAVEAPVNQGGNKKGWLAQESSQGLTLLEKAGTATAPPVTPPVTPPPGDSAIKVGGRVRTLDLVRMRLTAGLTAKPDGDVLADCPAAGVYEVIGGPQKVDNLTWWQVRGKPFDAELTGWMAAVAPNGVRLLEAVATAPGEGEQPPSGAFAVGDRVVTTNFVRLRKTPGAQGKPADDVIADLTPNVGGIVRGGPRDLDGMIWWQLEITLDGAPRTGWCAQTAPNGVTLLTKADKTVSPPVTPPVTPPAKPPEPPTTPSPPAPDIAAGRLIVTKTAVNVRKTPGMSGKPADDLIGYFESRSTLNVIDGPQEADSLRWWRVGGITLSRGEVTGWVAERLQDGTVLIGPPERLPGTDIPNRAEGRYLHAPFLGNFGISQLWGENPQIYSRFTYDGVPLKGHNGIDFLTPTGTPLAAVDDGTVADAVLGDPGGFGNYVKLVHTWGESLYAHMESISVPKGKQVTKGEVIGTADNTGFSGGPHLHFAIRVNPYVRTDGWGGFVDPLPYMRPNDVNLPRYVQLPSATLPDTNQTPAPAPHQYAPGLGPEISGVRRP